MASKNKKVVQDVKKDRLTFKVLRFLSGKTPKEVISGTELDNDKGRPVATATIRAWRKPIKDGGTRYPRANTMARVLEANGANLDIVVGGRVWEPKEVRGRKTNY